jgi:hypothetical protein
MFGKHNRVVMLNKNNTLAILHGVLRSGALPPAARKGQNPPQKLYNSGF